MLNILLVGNYPPDKQKSMSAFTKMIEQLLIEDGHHVEILNPIGRLLPKNIQPHGFWKWIAYIDKFVIFPFKLRNKSKKYDIVHICDHSNAMYTFSISKIPVVITCHDVLAIEAARNMIPGWNVGFMGKFFQCLIFNGLNKSNAIVCVSEYTKSHLKNLNWRGKNISVVLNSFNADFFPDKISVIKKEIKQLGLQTDAKYFIHVGSDLPRKNRLFILKIFNIINKQLPEKKIKMLFIGPSFSKSMQDFLKNNNLEKSVLSIENASHATLRALYSGALGLIFPSLQEGFGWPIIEAQACGCPVFTSNIPPMTEVGGDGAIYIDTLNEHSAANIIEKSLNNLEIIKLMGLKNITRFSKKKMTFDYFLAYQKAMMGNKF